MYKHIRIGIPSFICCMMLHAYIDAFKWNKSFFLKRKYRKRERERQRDNQQLYRYTHTYLVNYNDPNGLGNVRLTNNHIDTLTLKSRVIINSFHLRKLPQSPFCFKATLGPQEGPKGLGLYARRPIAKGEVVAAVPRCLVLESPLSHRPSTSSDSPLAAAMSTAEEKGRWYDVLGSDEGRQSVVRLAKKVMEEEEKGHKASDDDVEC